MQQQQRGGISAAPRRGLLKRSAPPQVQLHYTQTLPPIRSRFLFLMLRVLYILASRGSAQLPFRSLLLLWIMAPSLQARGTKPAPSQRVMSRNLTNGTSLEGLHVSWRRCVPVCPHEPSIHDSTPFGYNAPQRRTGRPTHGSTG
jgi:hypothetical protein